MQDSLIKDALVAAAVACGREPAEITLIAVSKGKTVEQIQSLYDRGQRLFGESKVQEVEAKRPFLPQDIVWHLIGTLQVKKVPKVIGRYGLIHSVDSVKLAEKISSLSLQSNLVTDVLLQVNASGELSKHGFSLLSLQEVFPKLLALSGIRLCGLMTMAPLTEDSGIICDTFTATTTLCRSLREQYQLPHFKELSMGMSHDFEIAISCGATMVRIGTRLFSPVLGSDLGCQKL